MALKSNDNAVKDASENSGQQGKDGLDDDDANLMIKLKFLTYKVCCTLLPLSLNCYRDAGHDFDSFDS